MDIIRSIGIGIGAVVNVVMSCGPSQLYGLIKGTVRLIQVAYEKQQIARIDKQIKNLQQSSIPNGPQSISKKQFKVLGVAEGDIETLTVAHAIRQKAEGRILQHKDDLKQCAKALVPLVGMHLAAVHKGYTIGPGAAIATVLGDISIPQVLFPGAVPPANTINSDLLEGMGAERENIEVKMSNGESRSIEAMWLPGKGCSKEDRTVILYHGNAMTLYSMVNYAFNYQLAGFNVLVTTLGGSQYKQTEQAAAQNNDKISTSELTMYADVDGEMEFLRKKGVKEVGVHGLSIGGAKAFQAADKYGANPVLNYPQVKFVVADQTFTTAEGVAANLAYNICGAENIGKAVGGAAAPKDEYDRINHNRTDGLNNEAKARHLKETKVELLCIAKKQDMMMGRNKKWDQTYSENFAMDLLKARYGTVKEDNLLEVDGTHCSPLLGFMEIIAFANTSCPAKKAVAS